MDFAKADDAWKVRLLLCKLGNREHERYADIILLKNPRDFTFDETVQRLSELFGEESSSFNIRCQCLKLVKNEADDFLTLASTVNRECEQFKDPKSTLQTLTAERQRLKNIKHDSAIVERPSFSFAATSIHAVTRTKSTSPQKSQDPAPRKPPSACWQCGDWHFARFCPFEKHSNSILATFQTEFEARRKYLTVTINGKPVRLELDTATDISLITKHTWQMIGRPPMITSDKKAMNVSGEFLRLMGELECDVSFKGTKFKGTCYFTSRPELDLISLD
ncbi:unnamed protein product [Dibothriocephalus latus]|uniref:DUF7083 domain-containing protein n=1 Tax=Dibothriocephalus latus TaxID=60516 RepID=A0A3P7LY58_DIBLA|nr:unnamed protein product [Dibothriocephalus latus]